MQEPEKDKPAVIKCFGILMVISLVLYFLTIAFCVWVNGS